MTIDEKLNHFNEICMEDARDRYDRILADYRKGLEQAYDVHRANVDRQAVMQVNFEREHILREMKRKVAVGQIAEKHRASEEEENLTEMIFTELRDALAAFMQTDGYIHYLEDCVAEAVRFAGKEDMIVYFDPSDAEKIPRISMRYSANILRSAYSFGGGMRAVIPSKNILIDHSFDKMVSEAQEDYSFTGGV